MGFSVLIKPFDSKVKIEKKSKTCHIQNYKPITDYFEREGIEIKNGRAILFKKVSKDFKTQERQPNETLWEISSIVEHKNYNPKDSECGEGKFHAVSRPYFGDEFRNKAGDRYIAIEVFVKDTYQWGKPEYPHKISFRKCKVLYECDRHGEKIK
jgi:hypothetical protein